MNLRELSDILNLSQTTVSRALNGYPEVSEGTRKRVLDAATKFQYQPNSRARALATGQAMSIGHVIPLSTHNELLNVIFSDFIAGAGEIYAQHGYDMLVSVVPQENELSAYREIAQRGAVDGFIVHGPVRQDPRLPLLAEIGLPFVVHGRSTGYQAQYTWLDVNNRRAFNRATAYLLELGHTRIGLINGPEHMDYALRRREGYLAALTKAGIAMDEDIMTSDQLNEPYGHDACAQMLALPNPPTALVSAAIVPSFGIRRAAKEAGLEIGRDLSVICFDDDISSLPNGGAEGPIFTATRSSVRVAGRRCAEMLIAQINNRDHPVETELWEADFILGQSTKVIRSS